MLTGPAVNLGRLRLAARRFQAQYLRSRRRCGLIDGSPFSVRCGAASARAVRSDLSQPIVDEETAFEIDGVLARLMRDCSGGRGRCSWIGLDRSSLCEGDAGGDRAGPARRVDRRRLCVDRGKSREFSASAISARFFRKAPAKVLTDRSAVDGCSRSFSASPPISVGEMSFESNCH